MNKIQKLYEFLINKLKSYNSDLSLVEKAFNFANYHHRNQTRISGDPYIIHPLEVAIILSEYYMDEVTISAALLHDVVEDTSVKLEDIYKEFGQEVGFIVESLTKLHKITPFIDMGISKSKNRSITLLNLKRLFVNTSRDIRVIIIKLADRLHNLRTIHYLSPEKQKRIALETLEFYVPISQKLGIWKIKSEMEDLAFMIYQPEAYNTIKSYIDETIKKIEQNYQEIIKTLEQKLNKEGIQATIQSRIKTVYSIYNKMTKRGVPLDEILDISAIRVIVNAINECYLVLGIIHNLWMPIQDRIKDYIAKPKPNGYQSLHTVVYNDYPIEFQIRTWSMHYAAEFGIASHWKYKGMSSWGEIEKIINNWKKELEGIENINLENIQEDVFSENIYVLTPKGDCIELPLGSTPIDFAYKIHTEIGNRCSACKVNGKIVPLDYKLKNGDIVEIIVSKNSSPTLEWLKIVKTSYARTKIKQFLKNKNKKGYVQKTYELFNNLLKNLKEKDNINLEDMINLIFEKYYRNAYKELEDFVLAVGAGDVKIESIEAKIKQILQEQKTSKLIDNSQPKKSDILLGGGVLYRFAKCCKPVLPQKIVGYITRGNGISIHNQNCPNIQNLNSKIINLNWDDVKDKKPLSLQIIAADKKGLLQQILKVISSKTVNITSIEANVLDGKARINIVMEIPRNISIEKLKIDLLKKIPDIIDIKN
ncbi:MAG: bifunctional (p)ppGpp synthetase/guanosine-3',5'-bis(diphosphate) 3'-pyrophosphohydrolase [Candidatus Calescibacterium sp.]|nr:bifunctional (p)ppGpp synthetase/guanosine-3',5'-bis(diphosphate) 3'-pyrophosphohydrolase [Candidatus Calescibacterium sp.]MCX7972010.1 bifunctional (p)ppGpp synthetase/guanosine-3',5'-bis(diphosphate) 3'-pyrophosphohydrolase [bacterium]MDW8194706.1 bifunctional (p)ppGpp synthetase/guanosine-3',5'-bis(diphosphate) 3'-pyrophosphohydrolase [Candidatus Calescibacterium sp.]